MSGGRNYRDLLAWQRAMDLVESIYQLTRTWPGDERDALIDQIRRAAISIPSNSAEGQGRESGKDSLRFLSIAHGSVREVETQLLIATRIGYANTETIAPAMEQAAEVGRLLQGLLRRYRD
jgi:four helix bundle protein